MRKFRVIAVAILSAIFLFAGHGAAVAKVLCVGSDGHVQLERAVNGTCGSSDRTRSKSATVGQAIVSGSGEDHCGPCVDIPIHVGQLDKCHPVVQVEKTNVEVPRVGVLLVAFERGGAQNPSFPSLSVLDVTPSTIACLRTVSLVI